MTPDEVARLHAEDRPGFALIDFDEVSLPFYWLTLEAIVQERKPLPPVEEFALGAIGHGLRRPSEIARFLGLEQVVVDQALVSLLRDDSVDYRAGPDGDGRLLSVTEQGSKALADLHRIIPMQKEVWVAFDRMTWRISGLRKAGLYLGRDLKGRGLREMRPRLVRRPEPHELSVEGVNDALVERGVFGPGSGVSEQRSDLLSIRGVRRADRVYLPAVLLVYISDDRATVQYAVAIDGRISQDHGDAVNDALESGRQGLQVLRGGPQPAGEELPGNVAALVPERENLKELRRRVSVGRAADRDEHRHDDAQERPEQGRSEAVQRLAEEAQLSLDSMPVRQLAVYEHPQFLRDALERTRLRLLIISPWLKDGVVTAEFATRLGVLASRGVRIHIGYGTGGEPGDHPAAERRLAELAANTPGVTVCRLGNTHAKILIADDSLITTSFNWLSFKGDPARTFRQEEGTLVRVKEFVDQSYQTYSKQIEEGCS